MDENSEGRRQYCVRIDGSNQITLHNHCLLHKIYPVIENNVEYEPQMPNTDWKPINMNRGTEPLYREHQFEPLHNNQDEVEDMDDSIEMKVDENPETLHYRARAHATVQGYHDH